MYMCLYVCVSVCVWGRVITTFIIRTLYLIIWCSLFIIFSILLFYFLFGLTPLSNTRSFCFSYSLPLDSFALFVPISSCRNPPLYTTTSRSHSLTWILVIMKVRIDYGKRIGRSETIIFLKLDEILEPSRLNSNGSYKNLMNFVLTNPLHSVLV